MVETHRRRYRRMMKSDMETIQLLHARLYEAHQFGSAGPYRPLDSRPSLQASLVELGRSMCYEKKVPDSPRTSPLSSQNDLSIRYHRPSSGRSQQPHANLSMTMEGPTSQSMRHVSRSSRSPAPSRQLRRVPPRQPPLQPQSDPQASLSRTTTEPRQSVRIINLPRNHLEMRTSGYITTRWSTRAAKPYLVESLDHNIISMDEARRHGLDVRELEAGEEGVVFDFGAGKTERSFGRTTLEWTRKAHRDGRPPLMILCEVCENLGTALFFGKPFLEEEKRRWGRRSSGDGGVNGY